MREITTVEYFEANAVDDFRVFFATSKLLIRHETEQDGDNILNAYYAQVLSQCLGCEEMINAVKEWLI